MFKIFKPKNKPAKNEIPESLKNINQINPIKNFENSIIEEYKIKKEVEFDYNADKEDYENMTIPGGGDKKSVVVIGIKGYDLSNLTENQKVKLYNTIVHELIHIRDREHAQPEVKEKLDSGLYRRHLGHFGYMIYDEYIAYKESNELFRQEPNSVRSNEAYIVKIFYSHMITEGLSINNRINRTENDKAMLYRAWIDYCSALIAFYVIKGKLDGESSDISTLNSCMQHLDETYENKKYPLSWEEYTELAAKFINSIIYNLSRSQRQTFKNNTELKFD